MQTADRLDAVNIELETARRNLDAKEAEAEQAAADTDQLTAEKQVLEGEVASLRRQLEQRPEPAPAPAPTVVPQTAACGNVLVPFFLAEHLRASAKAVNPLSVLTPPEIDPFGTYGLELSKARDRMDEAADALDSYERACRRP